MKMENQKHNEFMLFLLGNQEYYVLELLRPPVLTSKLVHGRKGDRENNYSPNPYICIIKYFSKIPNIIDEYI
jgi:hypothetical protein